MRRIILWIPILLLLQPLISSGQVKAPTLREKLRGQDVVWEKVYEHYPRTLGTLEDLIRRSDLIIQGRVVNERTRLTPDEHRVQTDYTIEVIEIYKDPENALRVGERLIVTKGGGNLLLEGKPIRMETPNFPPVPWIAPHVFFIAKSKYPDLWDYHFTGVLGVFRLEEDRVVCEPCERSRHPISKEIAGQTPAQFIQLLKKKMEALEASETTP